MDKGEFTYSDYTVHGMETCVNVGSSEQQAATERAARQHAVKQGMVHCIRTAPALVKICCCPS